MPLHPCAYHPKAKVLTEVRFGAICVQSPRAMKPIYVFLGGNWTAVCPIYVHERLHLYEFLLLGQFERQGT